MLTLLLGKDWTANQDRILQRIRGDVLAEKGGCILLVPEFISHDTERRISLVCGDTASRYVQVLSFSRLAKRICDLVGGAVETLDNGGRLVAMASAANGLKSELKAYAAVLTKPEFLLELLDAVDACKSSCVTSGDIRRVMQATDNGSFQQKLYEFALIMDAYDMVCQRTKLDPRDQMTWVLDQLEQMDYAESHTFYIDGFTDFSQQQLNVIEHLIRNSANVVVSLTTGSDGEHALAYERAWDTAKKLEKLAKAGEVPIQIQQVESNHNPMEPVREVLFQGKTEACPSMQGRLMLYKTNSVYQQCQAAAGRILQLVHSGCRYRDIALVCTDMAAFRPVLKLVFQKSKIPVYMAGTDEVLQFGVITTLTSALDAALQGFEQRFVLQYLRSSLSVLDADTCDLVENYAYVWRISGKAWKSEWVNHPQGLSGQWDDASKSLLVRLNEARQKAMGPLMKLEKAFSQTSDLQQWVQAVYQFCVDVQMADRIEDLAQQMEQQGNNRTAQILNQLWEILMTALEQLHGLGDIQDWQAERFTKLLKMLLSQYSVGTIPSVLDAVVVGPVSAMRRQRQPHLILLGAEEGSLPGYGSGSGLFSETERKEMQAQDVYLSGESMDSLQQEFAEIYSVFCGVQESICMLYSSAQPCFVLKRLEKMVGPASFLEPEDVFGITNAEDAGAYLARWEAEEAAQALGVGEAYLDTLFRKTYSLGGMEPDTVRSLYGQKLNLSASQIDRQAECRLSYFLQYGLRAQERKEATVDPAEFGTYVHAVLEQTARQVMQEGGFGSVSLQRTVEIAQLYSADYIQEHFGQLDSSRLSYLFNRNVQELQVVVSELWRELSQAQYAPQAFEMRFGFDGQMPAVAVEGGAIPARIRGLVDRVDTWQHADATFFRVVDYKTGKKGFDYCDIYNGVGLQMLLYLFALEDHAKNLGEHPVPAGVQYFPARAPYIRADGDLSQEELEAERLKQWKRQGLLLSNEDSLQAMDPSEKLDTLCCKRKKDGSIDGDIADGAQMDMLKAYIHRFLRGMVDEIASGNVSPNPYNRGTAHSACTFCPYDSICRKERQQQKRDYKAMTAQRFWEDIQKGEQANGG